MQQLVASDNGLAALPDYMVEDEIAKNVLIRILPNVDSQM